MVFLDVPPDTACRRIADRGVQRQVHETEEKLGKLREAYLMVCDVVQRYHKTPTIRVDGEKSPEEVTAEALAFLEPHLHLEPSGEQSG